jgi:hypothetical protein
VCFVISQFDRLVVVGQGAFAFAASPPGGRSLGVEPAFLGIGLDQLVVDLDRFRQLDGVDLLDEPAPTRMGENHKACVLLTDDRQ